MPRRIAILVTLVVAFAHPATSRATVHLRSPASPRLRLLDAALVPPTMLSLPAPGGAGDAPAVDTSDLSAAVVSEDANKWKTRTCLALGGVVAALAIVGAWVVISSFELW